VNSYVCTHSPTITAFSGGAGLYLNNYTDWVNLQQTPDEIFANIRRDHSMSFGRAKCNGIEVVRAEAREDLEAIANYHGQTILFNGLKGK
jgi:hypothetical protein